jgi:symplekin
VNSVKKQLKLQISSICKNSCCLEFQSQLIALLNDLGASSSEISKIVPKVVVGGAEAKKRSLASIDLNSSILAKKFKLFEKKQKEDAPNSSSSEIAQSAGSAPSLENILNDLVDKLKVQENVVDLVMVTMAFLPDQMPTEFLSNYAPISAAGTLQQIRTLAKAFAIQLKEAGLLNYEEPPQPASPSLSTANNSDQAMGDDDGGEFKKLKIKVEKMDSVERQTSAADIRAKLQSSIKPPSNLETLAAKKSKTFKLNEVSSNTFGQYATQTEEELLFKTYNRILNADG